MIRCECINNTASTQNLVIHSMASMNFPPLRINSTEYFSPYSVELPEGGCWIDGIDYDQMEYAHQRPTDSLVPDGFLRGEERDNCFVNGSALGRGFGKDPGDFVCYKFIVERTSENSTLVFRYRMQSGHKTDILIEGIINTSVSFDGNGQLQTVSVPLGKIRKENCQLKLTSLGMASIELDGMAIVPDKTKKEIKFTEGEWHPRPEIIIDSKENSVILKYTDIDHYYGIKWAYDDCVIREFFCDQIDSFMRRTVHRHGINQLCEDGDEHFVNNFLRPIPLNPKSKRVIHGIVCTGLIGEVEKSLAEFDGDFKTCEDVYYNAACGAHAFSSTDTGKDYLFSQARMAATTLPNVVFPVYAKRSYIKHYTPGRWWDCLYTWDSGFVGLGLLELDIDRATVSTLI